MPIFSVEVNIEASSKENASFLRDWIKSIQGVKVVSDLKPVDSKPTAKAPTAKKVK